MDFTTIIPWAAIFWAAVAGGGVMLTVATLIAIEGR